MTEKPTAFKFTGEFRVPKKGEWFVASETAKPLKCAYDEREISIDDRRILRPVKALRDDEVAVPVGTLNASIALLRAHDEPLWRKLSDLVPKPTLVEELAEASFTELAGTMIRLDRVLPILRKHGIDPEARA